MAEALKKRSEMDPQFQWDLRDLIPTEKALEELFSELESGIGRYEGFKGRLGEDAAVLKEYLDHDVAMDLKFSRLLAYAIQKKSTGFYQLIEFKAEPQVIEKLEINFRRDERVIRFLTFKMDKYAAEYAAKRRNVKSTKKED